MPILAAEPHLYPEHLWRHAAAPSQLERRWHCLHARPRREKAVARHLRSHQIAHYLPQIIQEGRTPGGRITRSEIPLFPGYLFLWGDDRDRAEAIRGNDLANVLEPSDGAQLGRELERIHRLLASGLMVIPTPEHPVGASVRVLSGPLQGMSGVIVRRQGRSDRFVAMVRFLGRGASVELGDWQVERIVATAGISGASRSSFASP